MTRGLSRAVLLIVILAAMAESVASLRAHRSQIEPAHWAAIADELRAIEPLDERSAVFIAQDWLRPVATQALPMLATPEVLAPPDLRGLKTLHVLGFGDATWSRALHHDLEDLPFPTRIASRRHGPLRWTTYALETARMRSDMLDPSATLTVETEGGPCRGTSPWKCKEGTVERRLVEIDHRARHCLQIDLMDGTEAIFTLPVPPSANRLRGHVGFFDFNGRLRSDGPALVSVRHGDREAHWVFTDAQGWAPFAVEIEETIEEETLTVHVRASTRGTWHTEGYLSQRPRPICIEARTFEEVAP